MGLPMYGVVDTGFLQLWVLQDSLFTMTKSRQALYGPHFLHGTRGAPGTWVSVQVVRPEWGTACRKCVRSGYTGPNRFQIF